MIIKSIKQEMLGRFSSAFSVLHQYIVFIKLQSEPKFFSFYRILNIYRAIPHNASWINIPLNFLFLLIL